MVCHLGRPIGGATCSIPCACGCEVASGKGSEVTVYRPGGRKFTLGHHTRNTHVPAHVVRALIKAVGIPVTEWWRTCAA